MHVFLIICKYFVILLIDEYCMHVFDHFTQTIHMDRRVFILNITQVFWYAIVVCIVIVLWGAFLPEHLNTITEAATAFISEHFAWLYIFVIAALIGFSVYLMFSRFGNITLGKKDDTPDYSLLAWFAMLFSAGMGIGLMFFTTAETISHAFINSPNAPIGSEQAVLDSLQYTAFHWGLH